MSCSTGSTSTSPARTTHTAARATTWPPRRCRSSAARATFASIPSTCFGPLGFGDVPLTNASSGASLTARELGILAQWISNRGSYGDLEFISPKTFEKLMPENLSKHYPGMTAEEAAWESTGSGTPARIRRRAEAGTTLQRQHRGARGVQRLHLPDRSRSRFDHRPGPQDAAVRGQANGRRRCTRRWRTAWRGLRRSETGRPLPGSRPARERRGEQLAKVSLPEVRRRVTPVGKQTYSADVEPVK